MIETLLKSQKFIQKSTTMRWLNSIYINPCKEQKERRKTKVDV
jgi:hypothetical protein